MKKLTVKLFHTFVKNNFLYMGNVLLILSLHIIKKCNENQSNKNVCSEVYQYHQGFQLLLFLTKINSFILCLTIIIVLYQYNSNVFVYFV